MDGDRAHLRRGGCQLLLAAAGHVATVPGPNNVLEFPSDYEEIFAADPDPSVGLCIDRGHFAGSGVDLLGVVAAFGERLVHIDIKDCAGVHGEFVPFGDGMVDFDRVLGAVVDAGYVGYLVVEFPLRSEATMTADLEAGAGIARRFATDEDAARD